MQTFKNKSGHATAGENMDDLVRSVIGGKKEGAKEQFEGPDGIKIVTVGVGGGGNNTINRLIRYGVKGTELVAVNTDEQHLRMIHDRAKKILIGKTITKGLGAGGFP
jgi:cell division protein FtsZ